MASHIAVVYRSTYGNTKTYAEYIAQKVGADLFDAQNSPDITAYEMVVFGGGLYAGAVNGGDWLKKQTKALVGKRLVLFTCGMMDPKEEGSSAQTQEAFAKILPTELLQGATFFALQGNLDYKTMKLNHKGMMLVFCNILKGKKERTPMEDAIVEGYGKKLEFLNVSTAAPIVDFLKG